jgi:hypothetical protein
MRFPFALALLFASPVLDAQQQVDVFPDRTHIYNDVAFDGASRVIYQLTADGAVEPIDVPVPKNIDFIGRPRPKIRHGRIWISNGARLYSRPLGAGPEEHWEIMNLPEGLAYFHDFEIISDDESLICGADWRLDKDKKKPLRSELHFVCNHNTGAIKRVVEEVDEATFFGPSGPSSRASVFYSLRLAMSYTCRLDRHMLIVGEHSGKVIVTDARGGRARAIQVVPAEEIPGDPEAAVNGGRAIDWASPLGEDEVLMCCRHRPAPTDGSPRREYAVRAIDPETGEEVIKDLGPWEYVFRTLDLKTGKVTLEGKAYRGFAAKPYNTLFGRGGELRSVRDIMAGSADGAKWGKWPLDEADEAPDAAETAETTEATGPE